MADENCRHKWSVVNARNGFLVSEGCTHCGAKVSYFTLQDKYQTDPYADGVHRWRFLGSSQSVKFDLKCSKCGKIEHLDKIVGLLFCTECREDCNAAKIKALTGNENTWVYLALCSDSSHRKGTCIGEEEIKAVTEYFNGNIRTIGKKIIFLPCSERKSIEVCEGEIIADVGMKEIY
ncbi:MAG: hypothetical protein ABIC40_08875 [bacterium]